MKYRYTSIFSIAGFTLPQSDTGGEVVLMDGLMDDERLGLKAVLTSQPNLYAFESDRSQAVAGLMLQAMVYSEPNAAEFKQRLDNEVKEVAARRLKEFGASPFLIVVGEGDAPQFNSQQNCDTGDFIYCFDAVNKDAIRDSYRQNITAILNSLIAKVEGLKSVTNIVDAVTFSTEEGKPVYSISFSGHAIELYISSPFTTELAHAIEALYHEFAADTTMQRVQRLIRSSIESGNNSLRAFLEAWSAFEIFVNKVFPAYETSLFSSMLGEEPPVVRRRYLDRIQDVMKDKYRLTDKFAAVSLQLSPDTSDADLEEVVRIKTMRDELFHGESMAESALPIKAIRDIAAKYLRLHVKTTSVKQHPRYRS